MILHSTATALISCFYSRIDRMKHCLKCHEIHNDFDLMDNKKKKKKQRSHDDLYIHDLNL